MKNAKTAQRCTSMIPHSFRAVLLLWTLVATTSCSIPYNRAWNKAAAISASNPHPHSNLSGAWQGTWRSEGTGHHGKLRAIATPDPSQPNAWTFRYHATWAKILSGGYHAHHLAHQQADNTYRISGEQDLGKIFGGTFKYDGIATPTHFKASYQSKADHGVFELSRP
jgi:hypothetical protein